MSLQLIDPVPAKTNDDVPSRVAHILVLDDNPIDIEMVTRCLRRMPGWKMHVHGCMAVEEALERIAEQRFDLLFLDYWLHQETGLVALERMREAGCEAPAVLMTGMRGEAVVVEALQAGVADYIPKSALSPAAVQRAAKNAIEKADLAATVARKQAALVETVSHLEQRQAEIESFYHNVSHELKTPLTGAREFVSLVKDGAVGGVNDQQDDLLGAAMRNCDQMVRCINDMLDASRLDTGKLAITPVEHDLQATLRDTINSLRPSAEAKEIRLEGAAPGKPLLAMVDPHRIFQVMSNLVTNAVKFSDPGSEVRVELEATDNDVTVRVIDHGRGLEAGSEERIFDRLYQSRKDDAATLGGLGMGLYIAKELVNLHGGEISVSSVPGLGCTFTFQLPRRAAAQPNPS